MLGGEGKGFYEPPGEPAPATPERSLRTGTKTNWIDREDFVRTSIGMGSCAT